MKIIPGDIKKNLEVLGDSIPRDGVPSEDKLDPQQFLQQSLTVPVIDVRAPKEYRQGHIPGAISLPLFDDEERALVGITYTHNGKSAALSKGLIVAGPKLDYFVQKAREYATGNELQIHCWRGGMRSEAMAWLIRFSGIKATVLQGGYKAYRRFIRESFDDGPRVLLLGGLTGSGKTGILHNLSKMELQVLDLEGLAHHKGSAFGSLGQEEQPTNEQFENDLAAHWLALDPQKPVWVEDESRNIGKLKIPEPLFVKMTAAKLVFVDIPFDVRVKRLSDEYGHFDVDDLKAFIRKIEKRMGGDRVKAAINRLENDDMPGAVALVLEYYDKSYLYGLSKRDKSKITLIKPEISDIKNIAAGLKKLEI